MVMANRSNVGLLSLELNPKNVSIFSPPQHVSLFSTTNQKILQKKLTLLERLQGNSEDTLEQQEQHRQQKEEQAALRRTHSQNNANNDTQKNAIEEEDEDDDLFTRWAKTTAPQARAQAREHQPASVHFPTTIPSYAYALATNRHKRRAFFDHANESNAHPQFHCHPPHAYPSAAAVTSASAVSSCHGVFGHAWLNGWPRFHSAEVESQERNHQPQHASIVLTHPASQPMIVRYLPSARANSSDHGSSDDLDTLRVTPPPPPQVDTQFNQTHKAADSDVPEKSTNELSVNVEEQLSRRVSVNSIGVHERLMAMAMKIHEESSQTAQSSVPTNASSSNSSPAVHVLTRPLSLPLGSHLNDFHTNPAFRTTDRSHARSLTSDTHNEPTVDDKDDQSNLLPSPASDSSSWQHAQKSEKVSDDSLSPNPQSALSELNLAQATADLPFELLRSGVHVYVPWKREDRASKRMSDADPHAFYSFSLSAKAPFLFLLRNIHSKRVKLSILLSRIHFICMSNDERASIFISYHGRTPRTSKNSTKQQPHQLDAEPRKRRNKSASVGTSFGNASNKRHLYLWPIDQRDCLSWFHLILRAWRTLKDAQQYAYIPKLNMVETLKKMLIQRDEGKQSKLRGRQGEATNVEQPGGACECVDDEDVEVEASTVSEQEMCYFCLSSSSSAHSGNTDDEQGHLQPLSQEVSPALRLTPEPSNAINQHLHHSGPPKQHLSPMIPSTHSMVSVARAASPAIPAPPPPTLNHCAGSIGNVDASVRALSCHGSGAPSPVVFHSDGSPVQGQQMVQPLQIELHCIEECCEDEQAGKGGVCARSSREVAVRISRHRRGPSYSAQPFNSPPAPLSNPLSSPHYRPIQRSKSNLLPAEEIRQQLMECRCRLQRLEFLATRLKKDECVLAQRNADKLASLTCRQKILKEQNILLRKIATQRMYERMNQASVYI